jgi:hypothetical protein
MRCSDATSSLRPNTAEVLNWSDLIHARWWCNDDTDNYLTIQLEPQWNVTHFVAHNLYKGLTENGEWYMDVNEDDGWYETLSIACNSFLINYENLKRTRVHTCATSPRCAISPRYATSPRWTSTRHVMTDSMTEQFHSRFPNIYIYRRFASNKDKCFASIKYLIYIVILCHTALWVIKARMSRNGHRHKE